MRVGRVSGALIAAVVIVAAPAHAHEPGSGMSALLDGPGLNARAAQAQPSLQPTPRAQCGPGSNPEPGMQGRVSAADVASGAAAEGFRCNTALLGREGVAGGYKALRYVDRAGRECAYYDTTLLFPTNAANGSDRPTGVAVLDMRDPAKPARTATLQTPAMQTPHESLVLNERRGLLAAVMGNPIFAPGFVDLYDLSEDCRQPKLLSSLPVGLLGHESGFAPDGNTFYATSLGSGNVTAVDVSDPRVPKPIWTGNIRSHGLTVSEDGNRAYVAANTGLIILDVSEVQARKANPQVREVSRLTWDTLTIPQVAIPVTIGGRPYLVEIDEFAGTESSTGPAANGSKVGAARIIDIADETRPRVVSNIRLEVHQPENRAALAGDPGASSPLQGYAGHYCSVPSRVDPGIVACSFIASGLRVFDIRDPAAPKELAYFVAPPALGRTGSEPSNYAMSAPAFAPERGEIWYSDGNSGFHAVRVANGVWPFTGGGGGPSRPGSRGRGRCDDTLGLRSIGATAVRGGRVRLSFARRTLAPVRVDVFRVSVGRRVLRERLAARFDRRTRSLTWSGRGAGDGTYVVRFTMVRGGRRVDVRRLVLRRSRGRFTRRPDHHRRESCGALRSFKLERPVFGGRTSTPLRAAYRVGATASVTVTILRGRRVVRRLPAATRRPGRTYRVTLPARGRARGDYRVRLDLAGAGDRVTSTLTASRL
jgi:hypothetical protein